MTENTQTTLPQATAAAKTLKHFLSAGQMQAMGSGCRGAEAQYFKDKFVEMAGIVDGMAKTYEQDGKGMEAIASLHYFIKNMDWFITEKDTIGGPQIQAFGYADLGLGFPEMGYICITDLIKNGVELDLFFEPKTLNQAINDKEASKRC